MHFLALAQTICKKLSPEFMTFGKIFLLNVTQENFGLISTVPHVPKHLLQNHNLIISYRTFLTNPLLHF